MKITKFGHCCMLIEENGVKLLLDPGSFTRSAQERLVGLSAVLITHEHHDHFDIESLKIVLKNNSGAKVICNDSVAALLSKAGIDHEILDDGKTADVKGVSIEGHGTLHAEIHSSMPAMKNTGFYIAEHLWYPGDALSVFPGKQPAVMALPIAGPWMKLSEAADYALKIKPTGCFPVHDMVLSELGSDIHQRVIKNILEPNGIQFYQVALDEPFEY